MLFKVWHALCDTQCCMRKLLLIACILQGLALFANATQRNLGPCPTCPTFSPNDGEGDRDDVWDLDHTHYHTWGINNFSIPTGRVVTEATLTFYNINNWTAAENNDPRQVLNVWLLDSALNPTRSGSEEGMPPSGRVIQYNDTDNGPDNLAGWLYSDKVKIGTYHDSNGGPFGDVINLVYTFSTLGLLDELNAYINNGHNFAMGFDPDCHYYNCGIRLEICTGLRHVPDGGATLLLLGIGLLAMYGIKRRLHA
jgi:hypothetical protein